MTWESHQLLAVANLVICLAIAWACICRLNTDVCKHLLRPRARYTLLLAGALASGLQPVLFGAWPSVGTVFFSAAVLAGLLINVVRWSHDHSDAGNI
ncbi:hypothetical protein J1N44_17055 [Acidovorax temperans]|nr:hypothetical protein [Acidovorax temperans]MBO0943369.1 hypothetical protein [Acidovorax temperans]